MQSIYDRFIPHIPEGGRILDAGCGSGRDTHYFSTQGFEVTAFDASASLVARARKYTQQDIQVLSFLDLKYQAEFDGIWSCASLLHVPDAEWPQVLDCLANALKPGGVWYMSFKLGDQSRMKDGRFFRDHTEDSLLGAISFRPDLSMEKTWKTGDLREGRAKEMWLNALILRSISTERVP